MPMTGIIVFIILLIISLVCFYFYFLEPFKAPKVTVCFDVSNEDDPQYMDYIYDYLKNTNSVKGEFGVKFQQWQGAVIKYLREHRLWHKRDLKLFARLQREAMSDDYPAFLFKFISYQKKYDLKSGKDTVYNGKTVHQVEMTLKQAEELRHKLMNSPRLLFISDTHGSLKGKNPFVSNGPSYADTLREAWSNYFEPVDAVICLGDIFLDELKIIKDIFFDIPVLGVPGNHEDISEIEEAGITNIHGKRYRIGDFVIAGFGGCYRYKDHKKTDGICLMTDEESLEFAKNLPKADILVSHAPCKTKSFDDAHSGLDGISWYISTHKPKYHFYGHIHEPQTHFYPDGTRAECVYRAVVFDTATQKEKILF